MGSIFLTWLADDLEAAGLQVVRYDGWETRARGSGGYASQPLCVMWHHTASMTSPANDSNYMCHSSPDRPIANLLLARDGVVWVLAAGATNTNGKGKDLQFSRGTVPLNKMNEHAVGMEIANSGVGEPYLQQQIDACFVVSNVINARVGNQPDDVCTHQHYAPDRKIDPARGATVQGPWQPGEINSSGSWDLADLRDECLWRASPPPTQEDDLTPEQAQQLAELHAALTAPIYAERFKDPGGVPISVPWGVGWTWEYVSQNIDHKLLDIIARLERLENP